MSYTFIRNTSVVGSSKRNKIDKISVSFYLQYFFLSFLRAMIVNRNREIVTCPLHLVFEEIGWIFLVVFKWALRFCFSIIVFFHRGGVLFFLNIFFLLGQKRGISGYSLDNKKRVFSWSVILWSVTLWEVCFLFVCVSWWNWIEIVLRFKESKN